MTTAVLATLAPTPIFKRIPRGRKPLAERLSFGFKVIHSVYGPGFVRHVYEKKNDPMQSDVVVYFFDQQDELVVPLNELGLRDEPHEQDIADERVVRSTTRRINRDYIGVVYPPGLPTGLRTDIALPLVSYSVVPLAALERRGKVDRFVLGLFSELGRVPAQGTNDRGDPIAVEEHYVNGFRKSDYEILKNAVGDEAAQVGWQERRPRRPKRRVEAPAWAFNNTQLQLLYRRLLTGGRGKDRETDARQAMVACYMFYRMGISAAEVGKELGLTRERVEKVIYNATTRGNKMFPPTPTQ